ncbi:MAG TPA: FKBP-type peptidyl-prolyl cis-trans isomerase [Fimbriimonas sp.]
MAKAFPIAAALVLALAGCNEQAEKPKPAEPPQEPSKPSKPALQKLEITDAVPGEGPAAAVGDTLFMLYTGKLGDDTVFDSTSKRDNAPFSFTLGQGAVIKGWDEGLVGMKVGGKRTLGIPWQMAYGEGGNPPTIPPKADLYFDVELLDLVKEGEEDVIERTTVKPGSGREAKDGDVVTVNYVGTLVGGSVFDEKFKTKPYTFTLGDKKVRDFFQIAVRGMKKGGERKVRVAPEAGFGPMGGPNVEGSQILYYTVKLVDIK